MVKGKKGFQKGHEQFNSGKTHFKKGMIPWNKGIKVTEDERMKKFVELGHEARKGKPAWNKGKKTGLIPKTAFKKGSKLSKEQIEKMKGRIPWNKLESREPYPYEFNNILKLQIRRRDSFKCQLCSIEQKELNERLIVHHIDFDKNNNSEDNLISLCRSCHGKVHCLNKMRWIDFFQNIKIKQSIKLQEVKNA